MKGTEKQIKWAEDIRGKMAAKKDTNAVKLSLMARAKNPEDKASLMRYMQQHGPMTDQAIEAMMDSVLANDEASWWIEQQGKSLDWLTVEAFFAGRL